MPLRTQPDKTSPNISYGGLRARVHPSIWFTDQGVPNDGDPNPDWPDIYNVSGQPWQSRMRPQPYKRGDDQEAAPILCIPRFFFTFSTDSDQSQTVYVQQDALTVVYYGNLTVGNLTYTGATPPACDSGVATSGITGLFNPPSGVTQFRVWWNQLYRCLPSDCQPDTSTLTIFNNGECDLDIFQNGGHTIISNGDSFNITNLTSAGCDTGDQHTFVGGTLITVTVLS